MLQLQKFRPVTTLGRHLGCSKKITSGSNSTHLQEQALARESIPRTRLIRPFSTTFVLQSNHNPDDDAPKKILVEQNFKVPSFGGTLVFKTPIDVQVKPTGALEYPNLDQAFFRLLGSTSSRKSDAKINVTQEGAKLDIEALISSMAISQSMEALIEIPIVHNMDIVADGKASIEVSDFLESDFCNLRSDSGDISASKIKTKNLNIETRSGDVFCHGHIQGNVKIHSARGNVVGDKRFMGNSLDISTDEGDIRVASCYTENSKFSTNRGSMNLRNLHNESYVAVYEQGDVKIHGIDGATNVFIKRGDLDAQISQIRAESRLHVEEGDIHLRLSDAYPLKISIEANDVIPDTKFQSYGKLEKLESKNVVNYFAALHPSQFSPTLVVIAENGNVILESQDWAASLGFKIMAKKQMSKASTITMATSSPKKN